MFVMWMCFLFTYLHVHVCCCYYSDIIKLTAQFVAHNGPRFMDQLMMKEQKNETFDFLRKNHILFTYFTKMVEQYSKVSHHV